MTEYDISTEYFLKFNKTFAEEKNKIKESELMVRKYLEIRTKECELAALLLIDGIKESATRHLAFEFAELKITNYQLWPIGLMQ